MLTAQWGPAVAKNPFLQFTVKGAKAGDRVFDFGGSTTAATSAGDEAVVG